MTSLTLATRTLFMTSLSAELHRVYEVASVSPLEKAQKLSQRLRTNIYLKREDMQSVHSFKLRGAYLKALSLTTEERSRGVIAASAGNHAQGIALAAKKLGLSALIVMPRNAPSIKVEAVKSLGAKVEQFGENFSEAAEYCQRRLDETGRTYIHPFDDPLVIAGQGTVGTEIITQLPATTHIFVPVGGGGLLAGVAQAVKVLKPEVKIIGVEPADSNCMQQAIRKEKRVTLDKVGIFADGVAVKQAGEYTFAAAQRYADDFITVSDEQICQAIKAIYDETRSIVEPAGALAVAGAMQYDFHQQPHSHVATICSGANMEFDTLQFITQNIPASTTQRVVSLAHAT